MHAVLHLYRSTRADGLVARLSLAVTDPLAPAVVVVPTRGIERWVAQRLAVDRGICANVRFPSPRRLLADAVAAASGIAPDEDAWRPERVAWEVLAVVDEHLDEPWLKALRRHLTDDAGIERRHRRLGAARHVAGLFDRYARHRPAMVRAWAEGRDVDEHADALPDDCLWQPQLWRHVAQRLAAPDPAARIEQAIASLADDPQVVDIPDTISFFGLTRLSASDLQVVNALAVHRDVHLLLLHPSPGLWSRLAEHNRPASGRRADDTTTLVPQHRLLRSWGHDVRELQLVLGACAEALAPDPEQPDTAAPTTQLQALQQAIRDDEERPLPPADGSIQVHACHGRARQVEVLRDTVLHLLADDPTLEPRDVIVMCPDVETYAPLIQATFGAHDAAADDAPRNGPDLRVRLADRAVRQTNPVLALSATLLDLATQRVTASQVLDLADRAPVRRRFGLTDDDLTRLETWVADSGIRWGLDAAHRAPYRLQSVPEGTFDAGLDRVALGAAMAENGLPLFDNVLPLDDVDSQAIALAGRFAELTDRLQTAIDDLAQPKPLAAFAAALAHHTDALGQAAPGEEHERLELTRLLDDATAEAHGSTTALTLPELRGLLADRLQGRPTRANFRTGALTVCTLMPMRSVPHRVVCLLGLDDGAFPRAAPHDGDDLLLRDPRIGERDPRQEDRQLLLDALMAATDTLVVTYTGRSERTNEELPPAVPIGELLDVLGPDVVTHHPLQPFDPDNFDPAAPRSFDPVLKAGAEALQDPRPPQPFLREPLPAHSEEVVALDDLLRFVAHPVKAFLRQRLGVSLAGLDDEPQDDLPLELDGLQRYELRQWLLDRRLEGAERDRAGQAAFSRGGLPALEARRRDELNGALAETDTLLAAAREVMGGHEARSLDVHLTLPDGRILNGTVPGLHGPHLLAVRAARLAAKHRLESWVRLLAAVATEPDAVDVAVTMGKDAATTIRAPRDDRQAWALGHLATLVDLRDRGLREPLPLVCKTSAAWAARALREQPYGDEDARKAWVSRWQGDKFFEGEHEQPEHALVFGDKAPFEVLTGSEPRDDERWDPRDTARFHALARRLWAPVFEHETPGLP
jgi:exodeoxyribonuclease V gamma subunit